MAKGKAFKKTTEALIINTEEHHIRINNIKAKIYKTREESKRRMCGNLKRV